MQPTGTINCSSKNAFASAVSFPASLPACLQWCNELAAFPAHTPTRYASLGITLPARLPQQKQGALMHKPLHRRSCPRHACRITCKAYVASHCCRLGDCIMEQGASTEQPPRSSLLLLNQQKLSAATEDAGRAGTAAGAGARARVQERACREQKASAAAATAAQVSHVPSTEGAGGAGGAGGAPGAGGTAGAADARCRGP